MIIIGWVFAAYILAGILFAVVFVLRAYKAIDPAAEGAGLVTRCLWAPGAVVLWPFLVVRWFNQGGERS